MNEITIDKKNIIESAKNKWNSKDVENRGKISLKYKHFFKKFNLKENDWLNDFEHLSKCQQNVIIKGELIRIYDSLSNASKTSIMREFGLTKFSSKWYKLSGADKKALLNYVLI
jgi:hypothetical protein